MSRLIDATKLRAEFENTFPELWHYTGIWAMIDNAPTVDVGLTAEEYQRLAARTINTENSLTEMEFHALFGMCSEIGELQGIYQKIYQGHRPSKEHMQKELGDLLWFIAEYCTARGWELEDIMQKNIEKLKARYPEGFESERSLHRKEGDV